jgi:hypothetical protein
MMPILCVVGDTRYRATAYGILNFAGCLCGGLAIYATGALRDLHLSSVQIINGGAVVMLLCPIFLFLIRPPAAPIANSDR